jgi:hypothetical protein
MPLNCEIDSDALQVKKAPKVDVKVADLLTENELKALIKACRAPRGSRGAAAGLGEVLSFVGAETVGIIQGVEQSDPSQRARTARGEATTKRIAYQVTQLRQPF